MVNLGKNIRTIGELKAALKDIPDDTLLNIGNRENGFSVDEIYYDGISVAMETKDVGVFTPAVNADFLLTDASVGAIDSLVELCSDPAQKLGMLSLREMLCDLDMEQWYSLTSEEEREWLSQFLSCEPVAAKALANAEESRSLKATNIEWDVDDEKDLENLPTEIEIPAGMEDAEDISDHLSELTGFCHKGFQLVESENPHDLKNIQGTNHDSTVYRLIHAMAEYGSDGCWTDSDIIEALIDCGVTHDDFIACGYADFVKNYFEDDKADKLSLDSQIQSASARSATSQSINHTKSKETEFIK